MRREKQWLLATDMLCAGVLSLGAALVLLPAFGLAAEWLLMAVAELLLLVLCALGGAQAVGAAGSGCWDSAGGFRNSGGAGYDGRGLLGRYRVCTVGCK